MRVPPAAPITALLLLAGCTSGSPAAPTPSAGPPSSTAAPTSPAGPPSTAGPPSSAGPTSPAGPPSSAGPAPSSPASRPTIVLEPDGLGFLVGASSIRHLTFATSSATSIRTALTAALGPLKTNPLPECGQGPRTSLNGSGFSVLLDGSHFVGWTDQGARGRRLTTADGIGIGSTLAAVKASQGSVTVDNATLGPEFFTEHGISGFLDGLRSTSKVTSVYAGETCFFR